MKKMFVVLVVILLLAIIACSSGGNGSSNTTSTNTQKAGDQIAPVGNNATPNSNMGDLCTILNTSRNNLAALNQQIANENNPLKKDALQQQIRQFINKRMLLWIIFLIAIIFNLLTIPARSLALMLCIITQDQALC